jgi:hypothetical protein
METGCLPSPVPIYLTPTRVPAFFPCWPVTPEVWDPGPSPCGALLLTRWLHISHLIPPSPQLGARGGV